MSGSGAARSNSDWRRRHNQKEFLPRRNLKLVRRRIPPLNPLRVFATVARTANLTGAAQELHVTQSAVSRQIAALESYLGVELLRRERHGVSLTRAGHAYAQQVGPAFETIAAATEDLLKETRQNALRLRTYTTFAAKWLIPRLPEFHARHPDVEVRLTTAVPDVDFDRDPVDMAIQFGDGQWPNVHAEWLFDDVIEPVCSPAFVAAHAPDPGHPESLLRQTLLEAQYRRRDWDDWLAATGLKDMGEGSPRMSFASTVLALQAAVSGLGVFIGQPRLLQADFASGQLVRPFAGTPWQPLRREMAYYLLRPRAQRETRKTRAFRDWLLQAVREASPPA